MKGIFHELSEEMRVSLVNICIENAPAVRANYRLDISKHKTAEKRKEEILNDKTFLAVSENILMHYIMMIFSEACCNTADAVDREMEKMNSK